MNTILTQTRYAGRVIGRIIQFFQQAILCLVYIGITLAIAPVLAVGAAVALGGVTALIRYGIEPGTPSATVWRRQTNGCRRQHRRGHRVSVT